MQHNKQQPVFYCFVSNTHVIGTLQRTGRTQLRLQLFQPYRFTYKYEDSSLQNVASQSAPGTLQMQHLVPIVTRLLKAMNYLYCNYYRCCKSWQLILEKTETLKADKSQMGYEAMGKWLYQQTGADLTMGEIIVLIAFIKNLPPAIRSKPAFTTKRLPQLRNTVNSNLN